MLFRITDLIEEQRSRIVNKSSKKLPQKRKRVQEVEHSSHHGPERPPSKRPRTSLPDCAVEVELQAANDTSKHNADPIETWTRTKRWPSQYFEQDNQFKEEFENDSWLEEQMVEPNQVVQYVEIDGRRYPRPIRKVPTSLRRKQSDSSLSESSDQKRRESKSAPYRDTRYSTLLAAKGSYMERSDLGVTAASLTWCKTLLDSEQTVLADSLFRDDIFETTCRRVQDRNESRVIRSLTPYLVPSAEDLEILGASKLKCLIENVNEGWTGGIPVQGPRPQPDYSVGFRRSAFTEEQLRRLDPLIGSVYDTSFFVATYRMYFPFFTCEVKCGAAALDNADRQNAHSMTLAVRGVVELYRAVKREKELHLEILAFSISHDHRAVRIYGHYPVIDGSKTTFYRHPVHTFDFTALNGKDKWTAYKFTKNVYDVWMPSHLKRICSVIDQLPPNLDFEVSQESELQFAETSGLSQELGSLLSEHSNVESDSRTSRHDTELAAIVSQVDTPDTSVSQGKERAALKKPKRKHGGK